MKSSKKFFENFEEKWWKVQKVHIFRIQKRKKIKVGAFLFTENHQTTSISTVTSLNKVLKLELLSRRFSKRWNGIYKYNISVKQFSATFAKSHTTRWKVYRTERRWEKERKKQKELQSNEKKKKTKSWIHNENVRDVRWSLFSETSSQSGSLIVTKSFRLDFALTELNQIEFFPLQLSFLLLSLFVNIIYFNFCLHVSSFSFHSSLCAA